MSETPHPKLKIFESHGVYFDHESGNQHVGNCPFTGKENKFYVNKESLLWDSKVAGVSGNVNQFMHHIAEHYQKQITPEKLALLAKDRQLPMAAFADWGIGWNGLAYTLPVRDASGTVTDIRSYRLKGRMISTGGASVGLLNAPALFRHPGVPVYLREGEWDGIAWEFLRRKNNVSAVVVAVPGAGTFKPGWIPWLSGRTIHTIYDNDAAGIAGDATVFKRLKTAVQRLTFCHWGDRPEGFDVRDWVIEHIRLDLLRSGWTDLHTKFYDMIRNAPRPKVESHEPAPGEPTPDAPLPIEQSGAAHVVANAASLEDVFTAFKKWLYLDNTDTISIMLASVVSQQIEGEPIWMFLVGPPGSAKTETLNSLSLLDHIYMTSSLTPHSLISGANWKDGMDPSLIPKLDGKVMVIKDFTSILSLRDTEKDEIFGILRDAYDGKCGKEFGNGVVRNYVSRFTMLAAVTPSIYALSSSHTALGERFLKFAVGDNLHHAHEQDVVSRAIDNIDDEVQMRKEMAESVRYFLQDKISVRHIEKAGLPILTPEMKTRIIYLARWGARMRGSITRDAYRNDIVTSRPSAEVGSRLGKQLAKLAQSLAIIHGNPQVTKREYNLVRKVMVDTIPQRIEDILHATWKETQNPPHVVTSQYLAGVTRYPHATITRILQDMNVLNIVERVTMAKQGAGWKLSEYILGLLTPSEIYSSEPPPVKPKMTIRRKR